MTDTTRNRPVALVARLNYSAEQAERVKDATTRAEVKELLRAYHDTLAEPVRTRLAAMREEGRVVDFATSWQMGDVVVHAARGHEAAVLEALQAMPELKDPARASPRRARR